MPVLDPPRPGYRNSPGSDPQWSNVAGTLHDVGTGSVWSADMTFPVCANDWRHELLRQIRGFSCLESGWDSYGGQPIDPRVIESAIRLVSRLSPHEFQPPSAAPTSAGGIQLEWDLGRRSLDIHMLPTGDLDLLFEDSQHGEAEKSAVVSLPLPQSAIQYLLACVIWAHDLV